MKSVIYGSQAEKGEMPTLDRLRAERLFPDSEKETVKWFRYFTWMPPRCFLRGVFWTCPTRRTQGMLERLTSSSSLEVPQCQGKGGPTLLPLQAGPL